MTYIEFFTEDVAENICASLISIPQRVILIGSNRKKMEKHVKRYHQLFLDKGYEIEFICKSINRNHLGNIVDLLCEIVEKYDDCVFDLTGGDELMLVATGIVYHRYRDQNIQMQRINLRSNTLYDCDEDGTTVNIENLPTLTVDENIRLFGGKVVYEKEKYGVTYCWDWNDEFIEDVRTMWDISIKNSRAWNIQIANLSAIETQNIRSENSLTVEAEISKIKNYLSMYNKEYVADSDILNKLEKNGLIHFEKNEQSLILTYKNEQVKRCLTKSGQVLETYVTLMALLAEDDDNEKVYNDVQNGVYIDWDGVLHTDKSGFDTENEIDVIMMHGVIPVFVSCKNGSIDIDELYKLNTVATNFGGKYAKKVLITTAFGEDNPSTDYVKMRSQDMNIRFFNISKKMTEEDIQKVISSLWCN